MAAYFIEEDELPEIFIDTCLKIPYSLLKVMGKKTEREEFFS